MFRPFSSQVTAALLPDHSPEPMSCILILWQASLGGESVQAGVYMGMLRGCPSPQEALARVADPAWV